MALSALNVLGDFDGAYDEKIDNLIMWEPAVADNAFTNTYTRWKNPIAMEIFPFAHKVPKQITVLYSTEDGVVDGDTQWGDGEVEGVLGGAYPKKYNQFFGILTQSTRTSRDYFNKNTTPVIIEELERIRSERWRFDCTPSKRNPECAYIKANREKIRKAVEEEAAILSADSGISDKIHYLKLWSCFRRFKKDDPVQQEILAHIIDILVGIVENDWQVKDVSIRPPMGARGDLYTVQGKNEHGKDLSQKEKEKYYDEFIAVSSDQNSSDRKIDFFSQIAKDPQSISNKEKPYFISHSAMREWEYEWVGIPERNKVFPMIYEVSYKRWIMRVIQKNSKFGRY